MLAQIDRVRDMYEWGPRYGRVLREALDVGLTELDTSILYYTTDGSIRGSCGHRHRSEATARLCLEADQRGCLEQGGYSDRHVVTVYADEEVT